MVDLEHKNKINCNLASQKVKKIDFLNEIKFKIFNR